MNKGVIRVSPLFLPYFIPGSGLARSPGRDQLFLGQPLAEAQRGRRRGGRIEKGGWKKFRNNLTGGESNATLRPGLGEGVG